MNFKLFVSMVVVAAFFLVGGLISSVSAVAPAEQVCNCATECCCVVNDCDCCTGGDCVCPDCCCAACDYACCDTGACPCCEDCDSAGSCCEK